MTAKSGMAPEVVRIGNFGTFSNATLIDIGGYMRLSLAAIVVFVLTVLISTAQDSTKETVSVAGKWMVTIQGQRGSRTQKMIIQEDGNNIAGNIQGDRGDQELHGTVAGNDVHFTVSMNTPRGTMTLEYRGTVTDDSMKGTIQGPIGQGSWSAKRKAD